MKRGRQGDGGGRPTRAQVEARDGPPEWWEEFILSIKAGLSLRRAAQAAGVPAETVESWIQDHTCEVSRTFEREAARRERRWILDAMRDPKVARFVEFMLRCTNREDFGDKVQLEHSGTVTTEVCLDVFAPPPADAKDDD